MTKIESKHFGDDRPVVSKKEDRLGFEEPARHVASAIHRYASPEGFVIGLEGDWGSGKSSFVNLIIQELNSLNPSPEIVKFSPWLISSRSALLQELFSEIAKASAKIDLTEAIDEKISSNNKKNGFFQKLFIKEEKLLDRDDKRQKLKSALNKFSAHLQTLGKIAGLAEALGIPYAGIAGKSLESAGDTIDAINLDDSLESQKEILKTELRKLSRKIIVFIDDLDRLEPNEVGEVVRLVRAVADFPNITYLLCYSRPILASSLDKAFNLNGDGDAYIEKIVQTTYSIPKPEDFDLRRIFREEIQKLFPNVFNRQISDVSRDRINAINEMIDLEGRRTLLVPRDIVRAINAMRLYAGPIEQQIDLADMIWLQLIRLRNHELYKWVEIYINSVAAIAAGARVSDSENINLRKKLQSLLQAEGEYDYQRIVEFRRILPGIDFSGGIIEGDDVKLILFSNISRASLGQFILDKRLGSPQHFRYYFALTKPSAALDDVEYKAFIANAEQDIPKAIGDFSRLAETPRPQGGVFAEAILDRLVVDITDRIAIAAVPGIILSLANGMDIAANHANTRNLPRYPTWELAIRLFTLAFNRLEAKDRIPLLKEAFSNGQAIGWLSSLMRKELFSHGIFGKREKDVSEWIFSSDEIKLVIRILLKRFEKAPPEVLIRTPDFSDLMFAWSQSGENGQIRARKWVSQFVKVDENFLEFLEKMRGWSQINDKVYYPLREQTLDPFIDVGSAKSRLGKLAKSEDVAVKIKAEELLEAFRVGEERN